MYKGEDKVLEYLKKERAKHPHATVLLEDISAALTLNPDTVRRIVESLKDGGYVDTDTRELMVFKPTEELVRYVKSKTFPEFLVFEKSLSHCKISELGADEKRFGLQWARIKKFVSIENGILVPLREKVEVDKEKESLLKCAEELIKYAKSGLPERADQKLVEELLRRSLISKTTTKTSFISTTKKADEYSAAEEFNINVASADAEFGNYHPITRLMQRISTIFTELGFEEMEGSIIQSSFWNFDALFQPQDHPARELADTFYLPGEIPLPKDKKLVERVKKAHEKGWKYEWKESEAKKPVLRTHTTALSARYLAGLKKGQNKKYFSIGRVFRNEATDFKHLAEFHQVEGIIVSEDCSFQDLLGTLKEFYRKLGFEKVRFRPSYFPYTEPSLEVDIYYEPRKQWMEIGGAGVFRPEVCLSLGETYPVLAWGLSLERPLMILMDIEDMRTFYKNDIDFLKSSRLRL